MPLRDHSPHRSRGPGCSTSGFPHRDDRLRGMPWHLPRPPPVACPLLPGFALCACAEICRALCHHLCGTNRPAPSRGLSLCGGRPRRRQSSPTERPRRRGSRQWRAAGSPTYRTTGRRHRSGVDPLVSLSRRTRIAAKKAQSFHWQTRPEGETVSSRLHSAVSWSGPHEEFRFGGGGNIPGIDGRLRRNRGQRTRTPLAAEQMVDTGKP
jgi:hypothetical protein